MIQSSPTTKQLVLHCPDNCSLRPAAVGQGVTAALTDMREKGAGARTMAARAAELLSRPVPQSNMERHIAHFREAVPEDDQPEGGPRPTDLSILDAIIASGHKNSKNWRPTIKDVLDAMKLKVQMTGQSAFEDMLTAMDAALNDAEDEDAEEEEQAPENVEAVLSPDERVASDADDD